jgi:hypothetical protein
MALMFIIALPVLIIAGYIWTHHAKRTIEYFNLKFTTHFGKYGLKLQERQLHLLEELNKNIKELDKKLSQFNQSLVKEKSH